MKFIESRRGKHSKLAYYIVNILRAMVPRWMLYPQVGSLYKIVDQREDKEYIYDRVNYYNKLTFHKALPETACMLKDFHLKGNKSMYFFDTNEFTRYFPKSERICYLFGDVIHVPEFPSIVKSRPLVDDNANSIILNLDKIRHFIFLHDTIPFSQKKNRIIFRGYCHNKPRRQDFINKFHKHPKCDVGDTSVYPDGERPCPSAGKISMYDHLDCMFVMALEGNDVATNLKWVMSTNSIAVMPVPTCETWYMEGRLKADYHYIAVKDDYSDLIEKTDWYAAHPEEAQKIIDHAHEWVDQFRDYTREKLISLMVLDKYFKMTGS